MSSKVLLPCKLFQRFCNDPSRADDFGTQAEDNSQEKTPLPDPIADLFSLIRAVIPGHGLLFELINEFRVRNARCPKPFPGKP